MNIAALEAALPKLSPNDKQFAQSLLNQHYAGKRALSDKQAYWVDKLAERATPGAPAEVVKAAASFAGVLVLLNTAAAHLKFPGLRLALDTGAEVKISLAGKQSKNPGFVYVRLDDQYVGKISPTGEYAPFKLDPAHREALLDLLAALATDPAGVAAAYGKLTGRCCFCNLPLSDERSTAVGYGKICADHYGLPWGSVQ